jgi:hypothetical protein
MNRLLFTFALALAAVPALAADAPHAISPEAVASAISASGVEVSAAQVKLLSDVVSSAADPQLRVRSIQPSGEQHAVARLECADAACLPFLVAVELGGKPGVVTAPLHASPATLTQTVRHAQSEIAVHSGAAATLVLNREHVHISIPVTCLANGATGDTVRVISKSNHQVYTAQVTGENLLSGRF